MASITIQVPDDIAARLLAEFLASHPAAVKEQLARTSSEPPLPEPPADPWDNEAPWTADSSASSPAASTAPSGASSARSGTVTDDKGRVWTFSAAGAPDCQCSEPAVMVEGKTNGKGWQQWRCAKDYDDYKHKCPFSQFVGGKGRK